MIQTLLEVFEVAVCDDVYNDDSTIMGKWYDTQNDDNAEFQGISTTINEYLGGDLGLRIVIGDKEYEVSIEERSI